MGVWSDLLSIIAVIAAAASVVYSWHANRIAVRANEIADEANAITTQQIHLQLAEVDRQHQVEVARAEALAQAVAVSLTHASYSRFQGHLFAIHLLNESPMELATVVGYGINIDSRQLSKEDLGRIATILATQPLPQPINVPPGKRKDIQVMWQLGERTLDYSNITNSVESESQHLYTMTPWFRLSSGLISRGQPVSLSTRFLAP